MHTQVDQRPATGQCLGAEPASEAGHAAAPVPGGTAEVELAEHAGLDLRLQTAGGSRETKRKVDHEALACPLRSVDHRAALCGVHGDRLLAQHMAASFECGERQ